MRGMVPAHALAKPLDCGDLAPLLVSESAGALPQADGEPPPNSAQPLRAANRQLPTANPRSAHLPEIDSRSSAQAPSAQRNRQNWRLVGIA